eukprot:TRINITY_DN2178_c3_g1_i2.p1 TRINITY_DN2178_c3_g1~~TRINITY_DN2178_c3_g1_i2.p1  ORF type:complete len:498 (+),score=111.05 TRINITY_DN2178_c3_g1_i2:408-1901(+)
MKWFATKHGYDMPSPEKDNSAWYSISVRMIYDNHGKTLLSLYNHSPYELLTGLFPDVEWIAWKFDTVPKHFWDNKYNQKKFFNWMIKELGYTRYQQLYDITTEHFKLFGGATFLKDDYQNSPFQAITTLVPEYEWNPWMFTQSAKGTWSNDDLVSHYLSHLGDVLGYSTYNDFFKIKTNDIRNHSGSSLLSQNSSSPSLLLNSVYPQYTWYPWNFHQANRGYWDDRCSSRYFCDYIGTMSNSKYTKYSDWYTITVRECIKLNGGGFIAHMGSSPMNVMRTVYNEYSWLPWLFERAEKNYWKNENIMNLLITYLVYHLDIKDLSDWYRVSYLQLINLGCLRAVTQYGGLATILPKYFPDYDWDLKLLSKKSPKKSAQKWLSKKIKELYPTLNGDDDILEDYKHPLLRYSGSSRPMELDIYIPSLNIAFEYHGHQHYNTSTVFDDVEVRSKMDEEKRIACQQSNIKLIEIPYWWDGNLSSLKQYLELQQQQQLLQQKQQ